MAGAAPATLEARGGAAADDASFLIFFLLSLRILSSSDGAPRFFPPLLFPAGVAAAPVDALPTPEGISPPDPEPPNRNTASCNPPALVSGVEKIEPRKGMKFPPNPRER